MHSYKVVNSVLRCNLLLIQDKIALSLWVSDETVDLALLENFWGAES